MKNIHNREINKISYKDPLTAT